LAALAALGQETRFAIVQLLGRSGAQGMAAGEIADALGQPAPTLSFHLAQLRSAGLLESRRESRSIYYRQKPKAIRKLLEYLAANCGGSGTASSWRPTAAGGRHGKNRLRRAKR